MSNVLKIEYMDSLKFKHLDGFSFKTDFEIESPLSDCIKLLKEIRECVRNRTSGLIDCEGYEVNVQCNRSSLTLNIMELSGAMSKPLGEYTYDAYMQGKSILSGITSVISQLEEEDDSDDSMSVEDRIKRATGMMGD